MIIKRTMKQPVWVVYAPVFLAVVITVIRLLLCQGLFVTFRPDTNYDDMMQIAKAFHISDGQWLGGYNALTLVKGVGYPLMTAFFHAVSIPYILGFHLVYVFACVVFCVAIKPLLKNDWILLVVYVFVMFNPIAFSNAITRYYRDILYYAVAFLACSCFVGVIIHRTIRWVFASGITLAMASLVREDSQWLYVYAICALLAMLLCDFFEKKITWKLVKEAFFCAMLGYAMIVIPICGMNYAYYQTFATEDFNSGSFAKAYGALSRLSGKEEDSTITIPLEQRFALYEQSDTFAQLQPYLDAQDAPFAGWKIMQGEYRTGYFNFIIRSAAQQAGYYENSTTSNAFWKALEEETNAYADTVEGAGSRRSGIAARFYWKDLSNIVRQTLKGMWLTMQYHDISYLPVPAEADDVYLLVFENYTDSVCAANRYMEETGEIQGNYNATGFPFFCQWIMSIVILAYQKATIILMGLSLLTWLLQLFACFQQQQLQQWIAWVASGSLLAAFLLRSTMIGFVDATTFESINNPAYQAASYVVMIGFIALQLAYLTAHFLKCKNLNTICETNVKPQ